jgi:hypothetical protein
MVKQLAQLVSILIGVLAVFIGAVLALFSFLYHDTALALFVMAMTVVVLVGTLAVRRSRMWGVPAIALGIGATLIWLLTNPPR